MPRSLLRLCALALALALVAGGLGAYAAPVAPEDEAPLFIVRLAGLPAGAVAPEGLATPAAQAALRAAETQRAELLRSVEDTVGAPAAPVFTYTHAFNGLALRLTPAQAAAVAALPGVVAVEPDSTQELHTDTGPAFVGAAQADQRPAIFFAHLVGGQGAPAGRAVFTYDATARGLAVQLFYHGLPAAPPTASLRVGPGGPLVAQLAPLAVPGSGPSGGYAGLVTLPDAEAERALFAGDLYVELEAAGGPVGGRVRAADGEGVLVGMLDSGINYDSPSFASPAPDGYRFTNPFGPGVYKGVCRVGDPSYDPSFVCNDKLVGAYTFPTTDESPDPQGRPSPRDNHGHGSHTASTLAGNVVPAAPLGSALIGPISGVAPRANLIVYDVCGLEPASSPNNALLCSTAAILAAIDQAVADGVDVINYSIGGGSRSPWASNDSQSLLVALRSGIFTAASAGNSGPTSSTISSPANAPWVAAVGAVSHGRRFVNSVGDFAGGSADRRPAGTITGRGFSAAYGPAGVVVAAALLGTNGQPNGRCGPFAPGSNLAGAIVLCQGSELPRLAMAANARDVGAGGVLIAADPSAADDPNGDIYPLPAVQISSTDGQKLAAWATGCSGCAARIGGATRVLDASAADVLAPFSARGPDRASPDVLKPDLTGPGRNIFAASLDTNPAAPDYQLLSGTSMAAPHVAGAAALLRQIHPDWTPSEIRSALMLTAASGVRREDGASLGTPYDRGAGRLSVGRAARAGLVMDEGYAGFLAADPAHRGDPSALNLPSLAERECAATCVFTRTLRSTLGVTSTWSVAAEGSAPLSLSVTPSRFTLAPGGEQTVVVTATIGEQPVGSSFFGAIGLTEQASLAPEASMPVAVRSAISNLPAALALTAWTRTGSFALDARAWSIGDLNLSVYGLARLVPEDGSLITGGTYTKTLTLPVGTTRFRAQLDGGAADLDLFVYTNTDGDGLLENGELLCSSVGSGPEELCEMPANNLINGRAGALPIAVLVENVAGSRPDDKAFVDTFRLSTAVLGRAAAGNLSVSAPESIPAGQLFRLGLAWDTADAQPGDTFIGVIGVGSDPSSPGDRGAIAFTLTYRPYRVSLPLAGR